MMLEMADPSASAGPGARSAAPGVAVVQASLASLAGEAHGLRRQRIKAAAAFLALVYGLLTAWVFVSDNPGALTAPGGYFSLRVALLVLRCMLAAGVAGLLASKASLTRGQLRVAEYALFLGLTLLLMASQYFVNLDLIDRDDPALYAPIVLAFVKDAVIQMIALMVIYGTFIPNPPALASRVIGAMFVGPVVVWLWVRTRPYAAPIVAMLHSAEDAGSNLLFLAVGAATAICGSFLANGLRAQLHGARKLGQYKLFRRLGVGGMGEVYLAEHSLLKRPCALKLIKPEASASPLALARFEREVQSSARLAHHNTIGIFDYGRTDDGTFYYVMEYLHGMSLDDMIRTYGPLPAGRVIYVFRQVCAGLAEAHRLGLVHRDLKPANLFLAILGGETDVAKVLDFGLVKPTKDPEAAALTIEMTVSGTPLYMAPEQARAERSLDARADIYALGAMMYHALTGQPPFDGESPFVVMMAHARDPVVPPSKIRPGVPHDLEEVVLRCLAKRPEERYPNVKALSEALASCASAAGWGPNRSDAWWSSTGRVALDGSPTVAPVTP
jgi:serine/threonine-protein kinase